MSLKTKFPKGYYLDIHDRLWPEPGSSEIKLMYKRWWMSHPKSLYTYHSFNHRVKGENFNQLRQWFIDYAWAQKNDR